MKKITYNKIQIQDFKSFENKTFEFKNTRNSITGKNGVGKSTLAESLVFALTGKSLVGGKLINEPILSNGKIKDNYHQNIIIDIEVDNEKYNIKKTIVKASIKELIINKEKINKLVDFNKKILEILGVETYEEFLILSNPKYLNSLSNKDARQYIISLVNNKEDFEFLNLVEINNEKMEEYKRLINLDLTKGISLNQLLESKQDEIKNLNKEITDLELVNNTKQDTLTKISQDSNLNTETLEQLKNKKNSLQEQLKELKVVNEKTIIKQKQAKDIEFEITTTKNKITTEEQKIENTNEWKTNKSTKIKELKKEFEELASKQPSNICPMCNIESNNMKEHFENEKNIKLDKIEQEIKILKNELTELESEINFATNLIKELNGKIKVLETKKSTLSFENVELKNGNELNDEISKINETLGSYEAITIVKNEIKENLKTLEFKKQQSDNLDEELNLLIEVLKEKAEHYNEFINSNLQDSKIKLFEIKKNGNLKEIFTIERNGIKFDLLNWAGQINAGIELVVFMQKQKGISLPIFIDNAESVNQLHKFETQSFELYVSNGLLEVK